MVDAAAYSPAVRACRPNYRAELPNISERVDVALITGVGVMVRLYDDANEKIYASGPWDPNIPPEVLIESLIACAHAPFN
jgi:hypothetical protein